MGGGEDGAVSVRARLEQKYQLPHSLPGSRVMPILPSDCPLLSDSQGKLGKADNQGGRPALPNSHSDGSASRFFVQCVMGVRLSFSKSQNRRQLRYTSNTTGKNL